MVVTALQFKISSRMCGKFREHVVGDPVSGGDSSAVRHQLNNVQHIQATHASFAAILADGSVVTWGHPKYGGDSSAVQDQRRFVAVLATGSIATWGSPKSGRDSSAVQIHA